MAVNGYFPNSIHSDLSGLNLRPWFPIYSTALSIKLDTAIKIYRTAVEGIIGFGCSSIYISKTNKRMLDTIHCKHLKNIMGLKHSAHSSPILSGLSILPVSVSIALSALTLFKSCFQCSSNTGVFIDCY